MGVYIIMTIGPCLKPSPIVHVSINPPQYNKFSLIFQPYKNKNSKSKKMQINRQKCQKLLIGTAGIYTIYLIGSLIQQRIMKLPYENNLTGEMENFNSSNAFILFPSLVSWVIGYWCNRRDKASGEVPVVPEMSWLKSAALILAGALTMTKAIYLTTFPLVTLFKSCNLLSVIAVGIFCSKVKQKSQKLERRQLIIGSVITLGVILYQSNIIYKSRKQHQTGVYSVEQEVKYQQQLVYSFIGIGLLIISLICDGLVPDFQAQIKIKYKPSPMLMLQHMNRWKTYLALIYSIITLQLKYLITFMYTHPQCLFHLLLLSLSGAVGQMFVYWLISNFRQHVVPFIITTRKILTVGISIMYFGHEVTWVQVLGIFVVFLAVIYQFLREIGVGKKGDSQEKDNNLKGRKKSEQESLGLKSVEGQKIDQPHLQPQPQKQQKQQKKQPTIQLLSTPQNSPKNGPAETPPHHRSIFQLEGDHKELNLLESSQQYQD